VTKVTPDGLGLDYSGAGSLQQLRERHLPQEIRLLVVAESPPAGGTFFYRGHSILYRATKAAFEAALPELASDDDFLDHFQQLGCYLDDLSPEPVNHLQLGIPAERDERRRIRRKGIKPLAARLREWSPKAIAVVVKDQVPDVTKAIEMAGLSTVPRVTLPFPGRPQHRATYVSDLAASIREWRAHGILLAPKSE
jgi:hypothetical protein